MAPRMLSKPSKMPGSSFSLKAGETCPASKATIREHLDEAICSGCYAKGGSYTWDSTINAQNYRLGRILESVAADGGDSWVAEMIQEIRKASRKSPYFRIHDSGDFFSPAYAELWYRICTALPHVKFWAPTREYLREKMVPALAKLASLPNVTVRPSAVTFDSPAPVVDGLDSGTAVAGHAEAERLGGMVCPATTRKDPATRSCAANNCTACWDAPLVPITYIRH